MDKYKLSETDARELAEFLCPLLSFEPDKRPTAQQCLQHPWLNMDNQPQDKVSNESNVEKVNAGMSNLQIKLRR